MCFLLHERPTMGLFACYHNPRDPSHRAVDAVQIGIASRRQRLQARVNGRRQGSPGYSTYTVLTEVTAEGSRLLPRLSVFPAAAVHSVVKLLYLGKMLSFGKLISCRQTTSRAMPD